MTLQEWHDLLREIVPYTEPDDPFLRRWPIKLVMAEDDCLAIDVDDQRIGDYTSVEDLIQNGIPALKEWIRNQPPEPE